MDAEPASDLQIVLFRVELLEQKLNEILDTKLNSDIYGVRHKELELRIMALENAENKRDDNKFSLILATLSPIVSLIGGVMIGWLI